MHDEVSPEFDIFNIPRGEGERGGFPLVLVLLQAIAEACEEIATEMDDVAGVVESADHGFKNLFGAGLGGEGGVYIFQPIFCFEISEVHAEASSIDEPP